MAQIHGQRVSGREGFMEYNYGSSGWIKVVKIYSHLVGRGVVMTFKQRSRVKKAMLQEDYLAVEKKGQINV